jgi:hypothetical protein
VGFDLQLSTIFGIITTRVNSTLLFKLTLECSNPPQRPNSLMFSFPMTHVKKGQYGSNTGFYDYFMLGDIRIKTSVYDYFVINSDHF